MALMLGAIQFGFTLEPRLPNEQEVQETIADKDFSYELNRGEVKKEQAKSWLERILEWFKKLLGNKKKTNKEAHFWPAVWKIMLYIIAGCLIFLIALSLMNIRLSSLIRKKDMVVKDDIYLIDEHSNIAVDDLTRLILQEEQKGNYRNAVRLMFIELLNKLDEAELIKKGKNKTNVDYTQEFKNREYKPLFEKAVLYFNYIWYRGTEINGTEYAIVSNLNKLLKDRIRETKH